MAKMSPIIPMVGADTKFQPVYVDDVAEAACIAATTNASGLYELGGPRTYTFRELMELMLTEIRRRRLLASLPFGLAGIMAWGLSLVEVISLGLIKNRQITADQIAMLRHDNVVADNAQTLAELGVSATAAEGVIGEYLYAYRPYGQYDAITESAANLKA
jgi:NADH dehydrogenase